MVWYGGMVWWCGMVWSRMVWSSYGMVWSLWYGYGMVWCGVVGMVGHAVATVVSYIMVCYNGKPIWPEGQNHVCLKEHTFWMSIINMYKYCIPFQEKSKHDRANVDVMWQLDNKNKEIQQLQTDLQKVRPQSSWQQSSSFHGHLYVANSAGRG